MKAKHLRAALCAAALGIAVLLSGCSGLAAFSGSTAPSSAAASSVAAAPASSAAAPSSVAASTSAASTSQNISLPDALNACLGWGGDAGSSLKSMIAACSLLDWAEDNGAAKADSAELAAEVQSWLNGLDSDQRANMSENWEGISANADTVVSDPASVADLLDCAGNPNRHASYTSANWEALKAAVNAALAA
jgi:hypothetical protein